MQVQGSITQPTNPQASGNILARAQSATSTGSPSSANNPSAGSSITANDFLTLLVTEMKNQDPTAQTDPNAYIDQLVQVNSLQQLISINHAVTGGS